MSFDNELFCRNLKSFREKQGLTEFELSIQSNINYSTYCSVENGKRIPNFKMIISIANALKMDITSLISENNKVENYELIVSTMSNIRPITDKMILNGLYEILLLLKTRRDSE